MHDIDRCHARRHLSISQAVTTRMCCDSSSSMRLAPASSLIYMLPLITVSYRVSNAPYDTPLIDQGIGKEQVTVIHRFPFGGSGTDNALVRNIIP